MSVTFFVITLFHVFRHSVLKSCDLLHEAVFVLQSPASMFAFLTLANFSMNGRMTSELIRLFGPEFPVCERRS